MAIEFIDPDGRSHWAEADSEFARTGLESGHLRRAGQSDDHDPVLAAIDAHTKGDGEPEHVAEVGEAAVRAEPSINTPPEGWDEVGKEPADGEQVEQTSGEVSDAAVEQDGDDQDAINDASGSGDAQRARRGSRKR